MKIIKFFKSPEYRRTIRRDYLHQRVMKRRDAMKRHVYVQTIYHYSANEWQSTQWIVVDGLRICEYKEDSLSKSYFKALWDRYYTLNRKSLLVRR